MKKFNYKIIITLLALVLPILYHSLNKGFYQLIFNTSFLNLIPKNLEIYLLTNYFILDSIFCCLMLILALPIYFYVKKHYVDKDKIQYQPCTLRQIPKLIIIAFGLGAISFIWQLIARYLLVNNESLTNSIQSFDTTFATQTAPTAFFWYFISIAIIGPIVEEVIFRGILFRVLHAYMPGLWVAIITGIYFGLWHSNPMQMVYTALLGIALGIVYYVTNNLWFPMLIHLFNNATSVFPPGLEDNVIFLGGLLVIKCILLIPTFIILYKMYKNRKLDYVSNT